MFLIFSKEESRLSYTFYPKFKIRACHLHSRNIKIMINKDQSTAVGWNCILDILTFNTDKFNIFAAIHDTGQPTEEASSKKKAACPGNSNTTNRFSSNIWCFGSAELAGSAIIVIVVDVDHSGALRGSVTSAVHWWGWGNVSGLSVGLAVHWGLSVHLQTWLIKYMMAYDINPLIHFYSIKYGNLF